MPFLFVYRSATACLQCVYSAETHITFTPVLYSQISRGKQFDSSIKDRMVVWLFICTHFAWLRDASVSRLALHVTLHAVKCTQNFHHTCWKLLIEERVFLFAAKRWSAQKGPPRWERGTGWGSVQIDRKIDCILSAASKTCPTLSLDNGRLPPKDFDKETACFLAWFHFSYVLMNTRFTWLLWIVIAACKSWIQCM